MLPVIAIQDSLTLLDALLDVKAVQNSLIPVITNYALLTVMAFKNYLTLLGAVLPVMSVRCSAPCVGQFNPIRCSVA